jgi:DNA polymerase-3 subunit alpha
MGKYFDLHRHDQTSFFDGFGKPQELASIAKELGYPALGISNHGNITGLVQHWLACKDVGIKPILGCEVYFQPKFNKENPQRKSYHLNLFCKNTKGYENLCHMLTEANVEQFYYKAIVDFKLLEKYSEGLICTTACIASATSQAINNGNINTAERLLKKFKSIFGNDLYIEIQPYKIDKEYTQEKVDYQLMKLARKYKIRCILTSDSHYGKKEDFDTYCKMHEIGKTTLDVKNTYGERYMPAEQEVVDRFVKMYRKKFNNPQMLAWEYVDNLHYIYDSVDDDILENCELHLPVIETNGRTSESILKNKVLVGLKKRGKCTKEYKARCLEELDVIHFHGFDDYFLMVQDYVMWAKENDIAVGPGRGSACNCLVAYALGITDVDSIKYKLDFSRFMRKDKKKLPDIDVDFETDKRQQVIDYVVHKHKGKAVQICSYGEYKIDNLVNDLAGVCGLQTSGNDIDDFEKAENKKVVAEIKKYIKEYEIEGELNIDLLLRDVRSDEYNMQYDNIIKHFSKMYGKIRYLGKHAAGVAVVGTDISNYTCMIRRGEGLYSSCYDLNDLEHINCTKFDMLGLKTLSEIKELQDHTGHIITDEDRSAKEIYENFRDGNTDGVFQMEKGTPKKILDMIECDCIDDVIAVNALNRPAPLQLKMHETYAHNKLSGKIDKKSPYYKYTKETYGTILYQEQTVEVAQKLGHLTPAQSFDLLKIMKKVENLKKPEYIPVIEEMKKSFYEGCKSEGITKSQTDSIWASMLIYGFNKGHSTGYALISIDQMWYKIHYPAVYWYVKMKYAGDVADINKYSQCAVKDNAVVMLPHVNYTARTSMRKMDGEYVIQQGIGVIKGVGEKAADQIENERKKNGPFKDYDDFYDRCKSRAVTSRVINILEEQGALEFNDKKYYARVVKYNSSLLGR